MRPYKYFLIMPLMLFFPLLSVAGPLVDAAWVLKHLGKDTVVFLDIQSPMQYQQFHIPGSINAPYDGWRTDEKHPPQDMLPPIPELEKKVGGLGIDHDKRVIIISTGRGAGDMAASARVFWTLRVLGHGNASVLNGGLIAYARAKGQLEKGVNKPKPVTFKAEPNMQLLAGLEDMKKAVKAKTTLVDARSQAEFLGIYKGGDKERAGSIPGAKSLPFDWLTVNGSGDMQSDDNIKKIFKFRNFKIEVPRERIHYCHTGSRAALSWFVDYALLGNPKARLYDGSTQEWASQADTPIKAEVGLW